MALHKCHLSRSRTIGQGVMRIGCGCDREQPLPPLLGTTKDDGKHKTAILKFYNSSKGGTDIVDQRFGSYTVNTK